MVRTEDRKILLLIEDNPGDVDLLVDMIKRVDRDRLFVINVASTLYEGIEKLAEADVVVVDLSLPDSQGLDTFKAVHDKAQVPIVVVTGLNDDDVGMQAIRCGAQDYLMKGHFEASTLYKSILYAMERYRRENAEHKLDTMLSMLSTIRNDMSGLKQEISATRKIVADAVCQNEDADAG